MDAELTRERVDLMEGHVVLEFGASWCGFCAAARPLIDAALSTRPNVRRQWVEDGKGKAFGRTFRVKLWPTLIFLSDGKEVARVVRPSSRSEVDAALALLKRE